MSTHGPQDGHLGPTRQPLSAIVKMRLRDSPRGVCDTIPLTGAWLTVAHNATARKSHDPQSTSVASIEEGVYGLIAIDRNRVEKHIGGSSLRKQQEE